MDTNSIDPIDLLDEWFRWWFASNESPPKMPNGLHVRTGIALVKAGRFPPMAEWIPADPTTAPDTPRDAPRT